MTKDEYQKSLVKLVSAIIISSGAKTTIGHDLVVSEMVNAAKNHLDEIIRVSDEKYQTTKLPFE